MFFGSLDRKEKQHLCSCSFFFFKLMQLEENKTWSILRQSLALLLLPSTLKPVVEFDATWYYWQDLLRSLVLSLWQMEGCWEEAWNTLRVPSLISDLITAPLGMFFLFTEQNDDGWLLGGPRLLSCAKFSDFLRVFLFLAHGSHLVSKTISTRLKYSHCTETHCVIWCLYTSSLWEHLKTRCF